MIRVANLTLRRGTKLLFQGANFTLHAGWKVGITGGNGCGKSTFFSLIRRELPADEGDISLPPNLRIAYVAQEIPITDRSALDYVMDGDVELRQVEQRLAHAERSGDGQAQAHCHDLLQRIDGYSAPARAGQLLHGLGFLPNEEVLPVNHFSGGWRMRLNLAQALMCRSDLLLLDEPTNHLDLDAVIWLEDWLRSYSGTLLLISHDRDFLDRVIGQIVHIEQQQAQLYSGNYSSFEQIRAARLANQQAEYVKQQREVAHIKSYVERFRAKATKARQAQSRLKALERMELIGPAHVDSPFNFSFFEPGATPHPLLRLEGIGAGYAEKQVLAGVRLVFEPGDRIGLLGPNGAGKSTLIKLLAGVNEPRGGVMQCAQHLKIGYFAQHQLEQLDPDASPVQHLMRLDPAATEQALRNFLGGFGYGGERAHDPVAPFSGGEKARLALALIIYQRPNLLLLDEPTNHLDLEMRFALGQALQDFAGALVIVSHDRHLLRITTDQLWLVNAGRVQEFEGSLDDYAAWLANRRRELAAGNQEQGDGEHTSAARKDRKRQEAELRRRLQPLRDQLKAIDGKIDKLHAERSRVETALAENTLYQEDNKIRLKQLLLDKQAVDTELGGLEEAWLELSERLEAEQIAETD